MGTYKYKPPLLAEIAAVLLAVFIVIDILSTIGLSKSLVSYLQLPYSRFVSLSLLITSILGIVGLIKNMMLGRYFTLIASVFQIVLGLFSILINSVSQEREFFLLFNAFTAIGLGIVTASCIFKTIEFKQFVDPPSLSLTDSSDTAFSLDIRGLTKIYDLGPTQVAAINGLNLKTCRGEIVAIMGPSGSGKSTLLNLIGALDRPTSGQIYIDGIDISTLDDSGLAKLRNEKIGFVFQSYNLINRSKVMRNIELPAMVKGQSKSERFKKVQQLLQTVSLNDKANRRPKTLSGGEQQRVAIARALVNDPTIILADEPTGNLDSKTGHEVMMFLKKKSIEKNSTLIIVTHDREVGEMANRIVNIRDGIIINEERLI